MHLKVIVFEVQGYASMLLGAAVFNLIFLSNELGMWRLMGCGSFGCSESYTPQKISISLLVL